MPSAGPVDHLHGFQQVLHPAAAHRQDGWQIGLPAQAGPQLGLAALLVHHLRVDRDAGQVNPLRRDAAIGSQPEHRLAGHQAGIHLGVEPDAVHGDQVGHLL